MIGAIELFLISFGMTYYVATIGAGLVLIRRMGWGAPPRTERDRRRGQRRPRQREKARAARTRPTRPTRTARPARLRRLRQLRRLLITPHEQPPRASVVEPPESLVTYFLVPCLNEELVIGTTIKALLADPRARVIVVDDGSDDATGEVAAAVDPDRVTIVRRELPNARLGKGPALNAGLAAILHDADIQQIAVSRIIVCVMDADGQLSPGALEVVLPLFGDGRVGGVQLPVKIRNTGSVLTTLQDLEFWGVAAVGQIGRNITGTVSLGGNGQFTRLTALLELGREPWRPRLTEDLDLGLALAVAGWRLAATTRAHVSQQGVPRLRALLRQRTRWFQGHLEASEWLGQLWSSRRVSHLGMIELTLYLLIPWVTVLPWSFFMNYNMVMLAGWGLGWGTGPVVGTTVLERSLTILAWYLTSFLPLWLGGFMYYKQRRGNFVIALLTGHLLLVGNYIAYVACWRALFRYLRGQRGWVKTRRVEERRLAAASAPVPIAAGPAALSSPGVES